MEDTEYHSILDKLDNVTLQNKQLKRANINKDKTIKHLRRVIKKMKDDAAKERKPRFKNGKRGTWAIELSV